MKLNIDSNGVITFNGNPFLWAAFYQTGVAESMVTKVWWQEINEAFTFNGVDYAKFDFLVRTPDGVFQAMTAKDFNSKYKVTLGSA